LSVDEAQVLDLGTGENLKRDRSLQGGLMYTSLRSLAVMAALAAAAALILPQPVFAASAAELRRDAQAALNSLYAKNPGAKAIGNQAVAVLVFPSVLKAGLGIGGQYGEGVLFRGGKAVAYYNTAGASVGLQAGGQKYGYAMFFLSEDNLKYLDRSEGFEVGVGPSVVVADQGLAKSTTTTTAKDKIYAFIFDQKGAMYALGIQGNKITKIKK
jgi:lipid-binding SYLF domain-containing protein